MEDKRIGATGQRSFVNELMSRDTLIGTALFGALSPGLLLTLPPESRGVLMTGETSPRAVAFHCVVFASGFALAKVLLNKPSIRTTPDIAPRTLK